MWGKTCLVWIFIGDLITRTGQPSSFIHKRQNLISLFFGFSSCGGGQVFVSCIGWPLFASKTKPHVHSFNFTWNVHCLKRFATFSLSFLPFCGLDWLTRLENSMDFDVGFFIYLKKKKKLLYHCWQKRTEKTIISFSYFTLSEN